MHPSALLKVKVFLLAYARKPVTGDERTILDVGACTYAGQPNAREACEKAGLKYVGMDVVSGFNVDLVSQRPFVWNEIPDESYDYVISTCTFEHNPYFWVTFAEIARVLKQGGKTLVTAPGAGKVHRFPLDCWRFYPDSWGVLCHLTDLELNEVINEPEESKGVIRGAHWWDSSVIATKPTFDDNDRKAAFYENLRFLTKPYERFGLDFKKTRVNKGPAFRRYMTEVSHAADELKKVKRAERLAASQAAVQPAPVEPV